MFEDPLKPINQDAANLLRPVACPPIKATWTPQDEEDIRWQGLISQCPQCGDRAYEHGHCFGCGKPLEEGGGMRHPRI